METEMTTSGGRGVRLRTEGHLLQQTLVVELVQGRQPAAAESEDASPMAVIPWRNKGVSWSSSVISHGGQSRPD